MKNRLLLFLLMLIPLSPLSTAQGYTFYDTYYGGRITALDARSLSLGHTEVMSEPLAIALNPAICSEVKNLRLTTSLGVTQASEDRAFPVHDSFEGFLTYNTHAMNTNYYSDFSIAVVKGFAYKYLPTIGLAWYPFSNFRYNYEEELRGQEDPNKDKLLAKNLIKASGEIDALSLSLSQGITSRLGVGASLNILRGKTKRTQGTDFLDTTQASPKEVWKNRSLKGSNISLGLTCKPSDRIRFGLAYRSKPTIEGDHHYQDFLEDSLVADTTVSYKLTYPWELSLGMEYRPRSKLQTRVYLETHFSRWSKLHTAPSDTSLSKLKDVLEIRGGIEHIFFNGIPARFGFLYQPSPFGSDMARSTFTFGTGFETQGMKIDLGGEVGNREYRQEEIFPENQNPRMDRVKESLFRIMLTVSYHI